MTPSATVTAAPGVRAWPAQARSVLACPVLAWPVLAWPVLAWPGWPGLRPAGPAGPLPDSGGGLGGGGGESSTASAAAAGAMLQCPCRSSPSRAAKQAGESKRGTHSQSTEPSRLISAADRMSPMSA